MEKLGRIDASVAVVMLAGTAGKMISPENKIIPWTMIVVSGMWAFWRLNDAARFYYDKFKKRPLDRVSAFLDRSITRGKRLRAKGPAFKIETWAEQVGEGWVSSFNHLYDTKATWEGLYWYNGRDLRTTEDGLYWLADEILRQLELKREMIKQGHLTESNLRPNIDFKRLRKLP